ncbi:MAG: phage virion morphogenesis protein [Desulfovibrionaceae bacterium]|nr:phage virion morphogenesis protein [Desulfovibrionaceae bacterium]MBF0513645.1 phage virion morphogenesis protein [Desulfovibrionaceae bacterium]
MIEIRIDDAAVRAKLTELMRRGMDLTPAMRKAAGIMADAVEENFDQEGRPKWPSLAAATIKARAKTGNWPGKILQRSGSLAASITRSSDAHQAMAGTNKVYAAIQHFGGKAGRGHKVTIPARPFMKLEEDDMAKIVKMFEEYLTK